jgi:hypothetical protein
MGDQDTYLAGTSLVQPGWRCESNRGQGQQHDGLGPHRTGTVPAG